MIYIYICLCISVYMIYIYIHIHVYLYLQYVSYMYILYIYNHVHTMFIMDSPNLSSDEFLWKKDPRSQGPLPNGHVLGTSHISGRISIMICIPCNQTWHWKMDHSSVIFLPKPLLIMDFLLPCLISRRYMRGSPGTMIHFLDVDSHRFLFTIQRICLGSSSYRDTFIGAGFKISLSFHLIRSVLVFN